MESNSILNLMIAHHALLEVMLTILKDRFSRDMKTAGESINEFKWGLEKHFFTEEKVIFRFCGPEGGEMCELVQNLVKEHGTMLEMSASLETNLMNKNMADITKLQELLVSHRTTEEQVLYPKLDKELDESLKEMIVERINEIPLKRKGY